MDTENVIGWALKNFDLKSHFSAVFLFFKNSSIFKKISKNSKIWKAFFKRSLVPSNQNFGTKWTLKM